MRKLIVLGGGAVVVALLAVALLRGRSPSAGVEGRPAGAAAPSAPGAPASAGSAPRDASPSPPPPAAPPGSPPSGAPAARPPSPEAIDSLNETVLMDRLRGVATSDAELAIKLARAGNRRFPDSPLAPERASILIHALANKGLSSEARGEAENMVNHYPDSSWVRDVEQFTGAHRHRNIRVNDAGVLEYYE